MPNMCFAPRHLFFNHLQKLCVLVSITRFVTVVARGGGVVGAYVGIVEKKDSKKALQNVVI
jgi:hypothetical protein